MFEFMTTVLHRPATHVPAASPIAGDALERVMCAAVERVAQDHQRWSALVASSAQTPTWRRVWDGATDGLLELHVVTWPTFTDTIWHRHEEATAFVVVQGAVTELRRDARGRLLPRKFAEGLTHIVPAGQVHDLRREQAGYAVTIHAGRATV